jgi:hypothetical protein
LRSLMPRLFRNDRCGLAQLLFDVALFYAGWLVRGLFCKDPTKAVRSTSSLPFDVRCSPGDFLASPSRHKVAWTNACRGAFGADMTRASGASLGGLTDKMINASTGNVLSFSVREHLRDFTGLAESELATRLRREGIFHFEGEHRFWNPKNSSELRWFYSHSVNYLFANAHHPADKDVVQNLAVVRKLAELGPVLDYSGGVGNNIIFLAKNRIRVEYFGIGMMEMAFAEYRVRRLGLEKNVTFWKSEQPWTNWKRDPVNALPVEERYGVIFALDVLEHIPQYERTVHALVSRLKPGGIIVENSDSYFKAVGAGGGDDDTRIHVGSKVPMAAAMGPKMRQSRLPSGAVAWRKL